MGIEAEFETWRTTPIKSRDCELLVQVTPLNRARLSVRLRDFTLIPFPDGPPSEEGLQEYEQLRDYDAELAGLVSQVVGGVEVDPDALVLPPSLLPGLAALERSTDPRVALWARSVHSYATRLAELVECARLLARLR